MPENLIYDDLMICADDLQKDLTSNLRSEWNQKNYCTKCNDDALSQMKKKQWFFSSFSSSVQLLQNLTVKMSRHILIAFMVFSKT